MLHRGFISSPRFSTSSAVAKCRTREGEAGEDGLSCQDLSGCAQKDHIPDRKKKNMVQTKLAVLLFARGNELDKVFRIPRDFIRPFIHDK